MGIFSRKDSSESQNYYNDETISEEEKLKMATWELKQKSQQVSRENVSQILKENGAQAPSQSTWSDHFLKNIWGR